MRGPHRVDNPIQQQQPRTFGVLSRHERLHSYAAFFPISRVGSLDCHRPTKHFRTCRNIQGMQALQVVAWCPSTWRLHTLYCAINDRRRRNANLRRDLVTAAIIACTLLPTMRGQAPRPRLPLSLHDGSQGVVRRTAPPTWSVTRCLRSSSTSRVVRADMLSHLTVAPML